MKPPVLPAPASPSHASPSHASSAPQSANSVRRPHLFLARLEALEARVVRFLSAEATQPGWNRFLVAFFLVWMALLSAFSPRASLHDSPLDFLAQVLSIASVGHISFAAAPRCVALFDGLCALALAIVPAARTTSLLLLGRLIFGVLPLLMLRDDLWRAFPLAPSSTGIGTIVALLPVLWAQSLAVQARWERLGNAPQTAALLAETPAQKAMRARAWRRFLMLSGLVALLGFGVFRLGWPRYLRWFHARQERAVLSETLAGRLIKKSMPPSRLLGGRKITTWIYLPPGYARSRARYPTIYLMHGMPGEVRDCFVKGQVQDSADALIMAHQVQPFILVGWDGQGPGGPSDVTNYLDRPGYPMESFITRELVPYIDRTYRTIARPEARALDGISAGGYGAANLLLKYPGLWKIGASHNGFFSPGDDAENMTQILGPKSKKWAQNDPTQLLLRRSGADQLHFYGDIGDGDDLQNEFIAFGKKLSARGIENEMHIFPGRHTWEFWSQHFNDSFRFEDKWFRDLRNEE